MKVWVVSVEYSQSNGEDPFGVIGVAKDEDTAIAMAWDQAEGYKDLMAPEIPTIVLAGEVVVGRPEDKADWDLWINVEEFELEPRAE